MGLNRTELRTILKLVVVRYFGVLLFDDCCGHKLKNFKIYLQSYCAIAGIENLVFLIYLFIYLF